MGTCSGENTSRRALAQGTLAQAQPAVVAAVAPLLPRSHVRPVYDAVVARKQNPAAVALGRRRMRKLKKEDRKVFASKGGKSRFAGWTAEQISAEMKRVRAKGAKAQEAVTLARVPNAR